MTSSLSLKVNLCDNERRRFCVQHNFSFGDFITKINLLFQSRIPEAYALLYRDDEEEWVNFETEDEWREAKRIAQSMNHTLSIKITKKRQPLTLPHPNIELATIQTSVQSAMRDVRAVVMDVQKEASKYGSTIPERLRHAVQASRIPDYVSEQQIRSMMEDVAQSFSEAANDISVHVNDALKLLRRTFSPTTEPEVPVRRDLPSEGHEHLPANPSPSEASQDVDIVQRVLAEGLVSSGLYQSLGSSSSYEEEKTEEECKEECDEKEKEEQKEEFDEEDEEWSVISNDLVSSNSNTADETEEREPTEPETDADDHQQQQSEARTKYAKQLYYLREMGFTENEEITLTLLEKHQGELPRVVVDLIKLN